MSADNNIHNDDVDVDIDFDDIDNDGDQHVEKKEAKTSKWNLGKNLLSTKKKSSNLPGNQRDNYRDQNVTNEYDESSNGNARQRNNLQDNQQGGWGDLMSKMRRKTINKPPDIEQGLGKNEKQEIA